MPPVIYGGCVRRPALRFSETRPLTALPPGRSRIVHWAGAGFRALTLLLLIVALAGPARWPALRTRIPTEGIALVMLLDVSGSMGEKDFVWQDQSLSRLDAAKKAFQIFVVGGTAPRWAALACSGERSHRSDRICRPP